MVLLFFQKSIKKMNLQLHSFYGNELQKLFYGIIS